MILLHLFYLHTHRGNCEVGVIQIPKHWCLTNLDTISRNQICKWTDFYISALPFPNHLNKDFTWSTYLEQENPVVWCIKLKVAMCVCLCARKRKRNKTNRIKDAAAKVKYFLHVEAEECSHHWSILNSLWHHTGLGYAPRTSHTNYSGWSIGRKQRHLTLKREQAESTTTQTRKRVRACLYTGLTFKNEDENRKKTPRKEQCMRKEVYILLWANAKVYNYINSCFLRSTGAI